MKFLSKQFVLLLISFFLASCATNDFTKHRVAEHFAKENGFKKELVYGGHFWITTFQKISSPNLPFVFYIEGDGEAFKNRYVISDDPTPKKVMLLQLASMDKRPNVVYVARPCQYTPMDLNKACNHTYWTDKRLSEDSIHSINQVISKLSKSQPVDLIGFSGGGGVAVLVAANNKNVKSILTIAANLDHENFNKYHRVRPMIGSLNPIDYAKKINHIPQLHISGGLDKVVPAFIADDFVKASANSKCVKREIISNATHTKNWDKDWLYILNMPLKCI
jgi:dienelactone hydrolase